LYGEDQARYLIATGSPEDVLADANKAGVPAVLLGYSGGTSLVVKGLVSLKLSDIKAAHEAWLPGYMNATD
jgi:phosphoribosylformylglycinamidine synthase